MSNLKLHVMSRKYIRSQITRHFNEKDQFSRYSSLQKSSLIEKLKSFKDEIKVLDNDIRSLKWAEKQDENEMEVEFKSCQEYKDKLSEMLLLLQSNVSQGDSSQNLPSLLKSPVAPLPKFASSDDESLELFLQQFEETTGKFSYTDYDRLLLLKQQVSGKALVLIDSLEADKQGYSHAIELLKIAFASVPTQKFNLVKQLSELKLGYDSEPFDYISNIRKIQEAVKTLDMKIDDVLQYFFLCGMNETFRNQLIQITNNSKPTTKEIVDNFFKANERYQSVRKLGKFSKSKLPVPERNSQRQDHYGSSSLAAKVNTDISNPFTSCTLCSDRPGNDHPIHKCPNFKSPKEKLARLKKLNGCSKCARIEHLDSSCHFRFSRRCSHCQAWHFSFLCPASTSEDSVKFKSSPPSPSPKQVSKPKDKNKVKDPQSSTRNGVVCPAISLQSNGGIDSILPTFSCTVGNKKIRGLKDSGSQANYISECALEGQDFRIVRENFDLTVNGFNGPKSYSTKLVEVSLKVGNVAHNIEAICVPSIDISLKLPGLTKVVSTFQNHGYLLLDEFLDQKNDQISNIQFILGANSSQLLMERVVSFGDSVPSVYYETEFGMMLIGNIKNLLKNLKFLPSIVENSQLNCSSAKSDNDDPMASIDTSIGFLATSCFKCFSSVQDPEICIFDHEGRINEHELQKATDNILERECSYYLHKDIVDFDDESTDNNKKLIGYLLSNTQRNEEGRLVMPLLWNGRVSHLLGKNINLAKQILKSNFKKLSKNEEFLKLMDDNIKNQVDQGLIERIENLDKFCEEHPEYSFLPHMGIFKLDRSTTKCRIVFLSNLCEKQINGLPSISHNQAMWAGPCINQKLSTALLLLRFDFRLLCFDLKKAFQQIALNEIDQSKLLFFWYKNVNKGDFDIVAYKNLRLSFGLRCSPTVLMIGLYKILMLDTEGNSDKLVELKKLIYSLMYMDNGALTANDSESLNWGFENLNKIFNPYKFELQQFVTNDVPLQERIDSNSEEVTPDVVKLFGIRWNRVSDTISSPKLELNSKANTKRLVLKSIASNFDPYNFNGPILNRARLFMHELQLNTSLGWDTQLSNEQQREWRNIAKQVNMTPQIEIPRFVGKRSGSYRLIAFTDSSKVIYGTTIFIQCMETKQVSFVLSKNRLVNKKLEGKSIPSLEFQAIVLGTETLLDLKKELNGSQCPNPVKIEELVLYSDSIVSLSWLNSYVNKLDKMNKRSIFIMNRLEHIQKICENNPVRFCFISGILNPADCITRPMSHKQLVKTNYFTGPEFLSLENREEFNSADIYDIVVPNPRDSSVNQHSTSNVGESQVLVHTSFEHLVPENKFSSFPKLVRIHKLVLKFIALLKDKVKLNNNSLNYTYHREAIRHIIRTDQKIWFGEIFQYLESDRSKVKDIPNIVSQLNVYIDIHGILRVKSKLPKMKNGSLVNFPILLHKHSKLTNLIIKDFHAMLLHSGVYSLLSEMRKKFWIPQYFSVVKKVLKECVACKRFNERTVKVNQNVYRDFRIDPPSVPFRYIFIDHFGPYNVKFEGKKRKIWILCLTCLWSRAINLRICLDLTTKEFLRSFQLHSFQYGIPQLVLSDLGSQLVAGANVVTNFLSDPESQAYFEENGVKSLKFQQYPKGCNKLGGLVESCVKMSKRLIHGAVRNNILDSRDFEFIVEKAVHLVNRRPIAFKEGLRDDCTNDVPNAITPEILIHGHDLLSINIIPDLQSRPEEDLDWTADSHVERVLDNYQKLRTARSRLIDIYNSEFLAHLITQATNERSRYKPVTHKRLHIGDIVLLKEPNTKPSNYPMGIVRNVTVNDLDEVTDVVIFKGSSRETVKRHVSSVIPLLSPNTNDLQEEEIECNDHTPQRSRRKAAVISQTKTRDMLRQ